MHQTWQGYTYQPLDLMIKGNRLKTNYQRCFICNSLQLHLDQHVSLKHPDIEYCEQFRLEGKHINNVAVVKEKNVY